MHSGVRLGATHSHGSCYGEELQRRMAQEGAISRKRFGETEHYTLSRAVTAPCGPISNESAPANTACKAWATCGSAAAP